MAELAGLGFDVVAPRLRGYEPSSQPHDNDYDVMSLATDVIGWLDDLEVERAHLVGHDWGAVIAYVVAAQHPHRVRTATTMAIPPLARIPSAVRRVPRQLLRSWYMTWFQMPWLSDRSLRAGDWQLVRRLWRTWSPGYSLTAGEWDELRDMFEQEGVASGSLAYYRQNATPPIMLGLRRPAAMTQPAIAVPTLIISGAEDGCMDRRLFGLSLHEADFPEGVEHVEIPDVGHFMHLEQPEVVNELLGRHVTGSQA
jgi:pimeloyl-ACP methyl ester carboxylesterase